MRYPLKQIYCRPWTLNGMSVKLMESHYENNYGGALRRLNDEHAYHIDFGANAKACVDAFMRNIDWKATQERYEDALKVEAPRPWFSPSSGTCPA